MEQSKFYQIKNITEQEYTLVGCDGNVITLPIQEVDKTASVFTIQDAKDGDVLHSPSRRLIWIYEDDEHYHACVNMSYVTGNVVTDGLISIPDDACPATRVQRSILFQKMEELNYKWDDEKKELKKISQRMISAEAKEAMYDCLLAVKRMR